MSEKEQTQPDWQKDVRYAGFMIRTMAALIDTFVLLLPLSIIMGPIFISVWGDPAIPNLDPNNPDPTAALMALHSHFTNPEVMSRMMTENLISLFASGVLVVLCWYHMAATPGKKWLGLKIVDAKTGLPTTAKQDINRYLGYLVSTAIFMIGFLWIMQDKKSQGWHDKMAGTVVVYKESLPEAIADLTRKTVNKTEENAA